MKMIILAAGQGTRLRPLTNEKPKCMVEYKQKPIIDYILEVANNITDIAIVCGYKAEVLKEYLEGKELVFFTNEQFEKTNMVSTLFKAKEFMDDDLIISYADIVYKQEVLEKLIASQDDFSVVVDRKWKDLWLQRMDNPLNDAETLKVFCGNIIEIGKKPNSYDDIEGQYIGLIKIKKSIIRQVINYYESLDNNGLYDGKDFHNMYMTSFIQMIINNLFDVKPVFIDGGWVEVDSIDDLSATMI